MRCRQPATCLVVYGSSDGEGKGQMLEGHAPDIALVRLDEVF